MQQMPLVGHFKFGQRVASGNSGHERHNGRGEMLWADDGVFS